MKYPAGETYALGFRAVQDKAPSAAGIYAIYTSHRWLYVGETDDIRRSLFQRLNDPDATWAESICRSPSRSKRCRQSRPRCDGGLPLADDAFEYDGLCRQVGLGGPGGANPRP